MDIRSQKQTEIDENFHELQLNHNIIGKFDSLGINVEEQLHKIIINNDEDSKVKHQESGSVARANLFDSEPIPVECNTKPEPNVEGESDKSFFKDDITTDLTNKLFLGATYFGKFLYSAGKHFLERGILQEFSNEQCNFINDQKKPLASDIPPWIGCRNEEPLKEECLSLSSDYRNFLKSPPVGSDFEFDYNFCYPIAKAIMKEDPRLEKLRYELVPKQVSEYSFWRNYFYRIGLIFKANESQVTSDEEFDLKSSSMDDLDDLKDDMWSKEVEIEMDDSERTSDRVT